MSDYPEINFTITKTRFEPGVITPQASKSFRRAMYATNIERYMIFIDGINSRVIYFDTKTMKNLSKRRIQWREWKANFLSGWWFDITYKRRYK